MWSLLPTRWRLLIVLAAAFGVAWSLDAGVAWLGGDPPNEFKLISLIATIVGVGLVAIANFLYSRLWHRIPALEARTFPDLSGTWTGDLVSTWIDPTTGKTPDPISAEVTIRMNLFKVSVSLKTQESWSHSILTP